MYVAPLLVQTQTRPTSGPGVCRRHRLLGFPPARRTIHPLPGAHATGSRVQEERRPQLAHTRHLYLHARSLLSEACREAKTPLLRCSPMRTRAWHDLHSLLLLAWFFV